MEKRCSSCGEDKPFAAFFPKNGALESFCKVCKHLKYKAKKVAMERGEYVDSVSAATREARFKAHGAVVHSGAYTYDKVQYVNNTTKVEIFCTKHAGYFFQSPRDHLAGNGCKACGIADRGAGRRTGLSGFIAKATKANTAVYDYSKVEYVSNSALVTIGCSRHGDFQMSPAKHVLGRGCQLCSREELGVRFTSNIEDFIRKAVNEHGDLYGYSGAVYTNAQTPLEIHCNTCGNDFQQKPANHLSGRGCPTCSKSGYDKAKRGVLYVLSCGDITKVGITNLTPKKQGYECVKRVRERVHC